MHVAGCRCVAFCCAPLDVRVVTRESGAFSFDAFFRIVRVLFCLCCVVVCFGLVLFLCSASPLLLLLRFLLWFRFFCLLGFRLPSLFSFLVSWRGAIYTRVPSATLVRHSAGWEVGKGLPYDAPRGERGVSTFLYQCSQL